MRYNGIMKVTIDGKKYEKDSEEYEWALRSHRFRERFIKKLPNCPKCNNRLAEYVFGLPIPEVSELPDDVVILGGCCVTGSEPRYHCSHCDVDFDDELIEMNEDYLPFLNRKEEDYNGEV